MGTPLSNMGDISSPDALRAHALRLSQQGGRGFLLSGGCDSRGAVPLLHLLDEISRIKETTRLLINAHIGFPDPGDLPRLVESGIDAFSINFPICNQFGEKILQVNNAIERYRDTAEELAALGAERVIPHFLIGLATKEEEETGLRLLEEYGTEKLVIIAFIPLKGAPFNERAPAREERIVWFAERARKLLPDASIALGCMRPRGYISAETRLMRDTIDGIVLPAAGALRALEDEIRVERIDGCCALYL